MSIYIKYKITPVLKTEISIRTPDNRATIYQWDT